MKTQSPETIDKKKRFPRRLKIALLIVMCICGSYTIYRTILAQLIANKLAVLRAEGFPVTGQELNTWYTEPPEGENAAEVLQDAFALYVTLSEEKTDELPIVGKAQPPALGQVMSPDTKELVAQYLAENRDAIELIYTAATMKQCRFPVDFTKEIIPSVPHVGSLKQAAKLLTLQAILHAENGDSELAVKSLTATLDVARSLTREPILISQLVRIACEAMASRNVERLINRITFTDTQLAQLQTAFTEVEDAQGVFRGLLAEQLIQGKALSDAFLSAPLADGGPGMSYGLIFLFQASGVSDSMRLGGLHMILGYRTTCKLPLYKRLTAAKAVAKKVNDRPWYGGVWKILTPALNKAILIEIMQIAQLRLAATLAAVERYRLANRKRPETLADLVPTYFNTVPEDPFDGKSLRYKKLVTGYLVYSIGENEIDEGGKEDTKEGKPMRKPDIVFTMNR